MTQKGNQGGNVGKVIPIPVQPTDKSDDIYSIIKQYTSRGDYKNFAAKLGVSLMAVSYVCRGMRRNEKIWNEVIQTVVERKKQRAEFVSYMNEEHSTIK
jgi:hypothetical protein